MRISVLVLILLLLAAAAGGAAGSAAMTTVLLKPSALGLSEPVLVGKVKTVPCGPSSGASASPG
jgi:hypothetical protein